MDDGDLNLDFGKKKKKKSKVKDAEAGAEGEAAADGEAAAAAGGEEGDDELSLDLTLGKKKKKKKAKARAEDDFGGMEGEAEEGGERSSGGLPWEGSDRDYTYEELLGEWWVQQAAPWWAARAAGSGKGGPGPEGSSCWRGRALGRQNACASHHWPEVEQHRVCPPPMPSPLPALPAGWCVPPPPP